MTLRQIGHSFGSFWAQSKHAITCPHGLMATDKDRSKQITHLLLDSISNSIGCSLWLTISKTRFCNKPCCFVIFFMFIWRSWHSFLNSSFSSSLKCSIFVSNKNSCFWCWQDFLLFCCNCNSCFCWDLSSWKCWFWISLISSFHCWSFSSVMRSCSCDWF